MNRRQRLAEVIRVCRREEVTRWPAPPDWSEWDLCPCCAVATGVACYDDVGSTRVPRIVVRTRPHPSRRLLDESF